MSGGIVKPIRERLNLFIRDESGQGIAEYSSILAFVAVMVAFLFSVAKGSLATSISAAFGAVIGQINSLSSYGS
jgi:Flp pilus assembly pilin Flp